ILLIDDTQEAGYLILKRGVIQERRGQVPQRPDAKVEERSEGKRGAGAKVVERVGINIAEFSTKLERVLAFHPSEAIQSLVGAGGPEVYREEVIVEGVGVPESSERVTPAQGVIIGQVMVKFDGERILGGAGRAGEKQEASSAVHRRTVG